MSQDYTINAFEKGDFQDPHGNYWCTAVLQGVGEPVKMVVKDPTKFSVGMSVYGDIAEVPTKKDPSKTYLRFKRAQKDESQQGRYQPSNNSAPKKEWVDNSDVIRAQWAIGQAASLFNPLFVAASEAKMKIEDFTEINGHIEKQAKLFYAMVDRVKGGTKPSTQNDTQDVSDEELASLGGRYDININDIPF